MPSNDPATPNDQHDSPVTEVARAAVRLSFVTIRRLYKRATRRKSESSSQVDDVHYLRVGTRRSLAALHLYKDPFSERRCHRLKQILRKIRRVAGPVRDLDVLIPWLQEVELPPENILMRAATLAWATHRQTQVQSKLHKSRSRLPPRHLKKKMQRLLKSIRWRASNSNNNGAKLEEPLWGDDGPRRLELIAHPFLGVLWSDVSELDQLHQLRIQAKRLRYTLDLVASAFPPEQVVHLTGQLRELQEGLGVVNDRAEAQRILREWEDNCNSPHVGAVVLYLIQQNESALEAARLRFRAGWTIERIQRIQASLRDLLPLLPPQPNQVTTSA